MTKKAPAEGALKLSKGKEKTEESRLANYPKTDVHDGCNFELLDAGRHSSVCLYSLPLARALSRRRLPVCCFAGDLCWPTSARGATSGR